MIKKRTVVTIMVCLMLSLTVASVYAKLVCADAGKTAVADLKGRWYSNSMDENGPVFYAKFTKKYAKYYYYDPSSGKYELKEKARIKSAKKYGSGYWIKVKSGKNKYSYRTADGDVNILEYYGTWNRDNMSDTYSGSSSLSRY